jgi:malonate transporter
MMSTNLSYKFAGRPELAGKDPMSLLTGFVAIAAVVGCGAALAHLGRLDERAQRTLSDLSFFVATPALMLLTISRVDLGAELGANLLASASSFLVAGGTYVAVARLLWRLDLGRVLVGALSSSYVNAGNLGLAVGTYVVGDTAAVVPTLMLQTLVVQPLALAALDRRASRRGGAGSPWRRLLTNPLTIASAAGLGLAATGTRIPELVEAPTRLVAGFAIPAMLLAYGASLRLSPGVGRSGHNREVALALALKLGVQPLVAWAVGLACGLDDRVLVGVVITAALPTAQNIFLLASRYRVGEGIARETILLTTVSCLPVSLAVTLMLA